MSELIPLRRSGRSLSAAAAGSPTPVARRAFIETYGCQMNLSDSELMAGALVRRGYVTVSDPAAADVIVVNTCAIREHAEQRVLGRIGQLQQYRRARPDLVVAVTGCMAQRMGRRLLERGSGVDLVAGPDSYRSLGELVDGILDGGIGRGQALLEQDGTEEYEGLTSVRRSGVTAWVTVQRGCNHRCTFCIVPYVRGPEKNRAPAAILDEIRQAVEGGFTEVTLLGQTVNSYRRDGWDFPRLLRAVARVPGIRRVRFTSPHPNDVGEGLLRVMAEEPAVCRQLHLPLQSGSDRILKRMVRRYTAREFLGKVGLARRMVPGVALSTDIIVGFSGETDADFEATVSVMREVRFDDAFLYRFSPRPGTPATRLPARDEVSPHVAAERLERVIALHRRLQRERNEAEVGTVQEVLVEREARTEGDVLGRTERGKVVAFPGDPACVGTYRQVRLLSTTGPTFRGEPVS